MAGHLENVRRLLNEGAPADYADMVIRVDIDAVRYQDPFKSGTCDKERCRSSSWHHPSFTGKNSLNGNNCFTGDNIT